MFDSLFSLIEVETVDDSLELLVKVAVELVLEDAVVVIGGLQSDMRLVEAVEGVNLEGIGKNQYLIRKEGNRHQKARRAFRPTRPRPIRWSVVIIISHGVRPSVRPKKKKTRYNANVKTKYS